jgi:hypothetical protein
MPLTTRSRKFAQLVAAGLLQTDALEVAYGKGRGKRKTRSEEASRLAAKPEVRAAIAEYEEQLMPIGNLRAIREEMLSNMRHLARNSPDHRVRLSASKMLHDICEERCHREEAERKTVTVDALIAELAELAPQPRLELETAGSEAGEPTALDAAAESTDH